MAIIMKVKGTGKGLLNKQSTGEFFCAISVHYCQSIGEQQIYGRRQVNMQPRPTLWLRLWVGLNVPDILHAHAG